MKRVLNFASVLSLSILTASPSHMCWGQVVGIEAQLPGRGTGGLAPLTPGAQNLTSPALQGGIPLLKGSSLPGLAAPAVKAVVQTKAVVIPALNAPQSNDGEKKPEGALESAKDVAAKVGPGTDGQAKSDSEVQKTSGQFFDQKVGKNGEASGNDGVGGNGVGIVASDLGGGASINNPYPRVVFIQDVFSKPASDKTVQYVEKLLDSGVHVVFLTWRAQKGPGSAEEILLGRLKAHRNNPIMIAAFNGGKISIHGRAANPKSIVEDELAFKPAEISALQGIGAKLGAVSETALPAAEAAFTYTAEIPADVKPEDAAAARATLVRNYNAALTAADLPFRVSAHPDNPRAVISQSMPMRFSLPRVLEALDGLFPGENIQQSPEKFLVLTDSKKSPKFSTSFPKPSELQVVTSGDGVEETLGAVLGDRSLGNVSVNLSKVRQFVEFWEPSRRYSSSDGESHGGGGAAVPYEKTDRETNGKFGMYTWSVVSNYMAWFYEQVWRGQHQNVTLLASQARLRSMWYNPLKYRVWVTKPLAKIMGTPAWKGMSRGYLEYANAYLTNFYQREFGEYTLAARNVQENLVSLSSDRKSLITLDFVSASTGKIYKIHTRIPRVMKLDTAEGRVLTAYVYRTGKKSDEDLMAQAMAMALLKGHAHKGPDGKWHHGSEDGPVIAKLKVQMEYRADHKLFVYNPEEFLKLSDGRVVQGHIAQEITSTIERMEADQEYQTYFEEHQDVASKKDIKKKAPAKAPAKAKAGAKTKTASETAKPKIVARAVKPKTGRKS